MSDVDPPTEDRSHVVFPSRNDCPPRLRPQLDRLLNDAAVEYVAMRRARHRRSA